MIRMHKKKYGFKQFFIIFVVSAVIFWSILYLLVKDERNLSFIEKAIKDGILIVNKVVLVPFSYVINSNNVSNSSKFLEIEKKFEDSESAKISELNKEITELKKLLELDNVLSDYFIVNAVVSNRNIGFWYNTFTINKGSKDGIKENMAVVDYSGLVGRIIKTTSYTSTVKLLSSSASDNKISVQIIVDGKAIYGILENYDVKNNLYTIDGITENVDITTGSLVMTTGLGDLFPAGILVGIVDSVIKDNFDLAPIVKVKPSVDFNGITYVKVLGRNVP